MVSYLNRKGFWNPPIYEAKNWILLPWILNSSPWTLSSNPLGADPGRANRDCRRESQYLRTRSPPRELRVWTGTGRPTGPYNCAAHEASSRDRICRSCSRVGFCPASSRWRWRPPSDQRQRWNYMHKIISIFVSTAYNWVRSYEYTS